MLQQNTFTNGGTAIILNECIYTEKCISKVQYNESAWNYYKGIYNKYKNVTEIGQHMENR